MNTETENENVTNEAATEAATEATGSDAQAEQVAQQEAADNDEDERDDDSNGEDEGEDRKRKPKRPRWSDLNRAQREALEARRELEELRRQLAERDGKREEPTPAKPEGKPTLEQYDYDQEAYLTALADWRLAEREREREQQTQQQQAQQATAERITQLQAAEAEFSKANPDYEGVAKNPQVPITQLMADVMLENPSTAPAIAYYLGQNVEEAARIAQMTPVQAARAIGAIEAKVTTTPKPAPPPKPVKKAAPVVPTLNSGAPAVKDWSQMSTDEHVRHYLAKKNAR